MSIAFVANEPSTGTGLGTNVNVVNTPNVNVINTVKVDFGTDPGTGSPVLDTTPRAAEILGPLTSLMPDLRSFQLPGHSGASPEPTFDLFGKSMVIDSHCAIAERRRVALAAVMAVVGC